MRKKLIKLLNLLNRNIIIKNELLKELGEQRENIGFNRRINAIDNFIEPRRR